MREIRCTACGSPDMVRIGDFYICQHCETKYELTYEDFLHNKDYYKDEEPTEEEWEKIREIVETPDESDLPKYNPYLFDGANRKCFLRKLFSSPSLQYNEFLLAIVMLILGSIFFQFKFELTVLAGALCCFVSIALILHFLFRLLFNFGYYYDPTTRFKDNDIVIRYAVKVWEANNKDEIKEVVAEFKQEKTKLKEEYRAKKREMRLKEEKTGGLL